MTESVTALLKQLGAGDRGVLDELIPIVYRELHKIAESYLQREPIGRTLQPTSLIHEAYLRLVDQSHPAYTGRAHFYGVAARLMRQILVDHARARQSLKRGGDLANVPLTDNLLIQGRLEPMVDLDDALHRLDKSDARKAQFIEMRFFAGMTADEISECAAVPVYTVRRELRLAQAWLHKELVP